jgi:hypothetical protein
MLWLRKRMKQELSSNDKNKWCTSQTSGSQSKNGARCWWLTPIILATREAEIGRIKVQGKTPISKITRAKWTGGVAQAVERLFASAKP